jgi:hypothetical protein
MLEGIKYEKVAGQHWEMSRIEQDAEDGIVRYLGNRYEVQNRAIDVTSMSEFRFDEARPFRDSAFSMAVRLNSPSPAENSAPFCQTGKYIVVPATSSLLSTLPPCSRGSTVLIAP